MADQPGAELILDTEGDRRVMSPSREYEVGRDPHSDIVLTDPRVSWHHAVLHIREGHWTVDDVGSTNGIFDAGGHRVRHLEVGPGSRFRFGNPTDGPLAALSAPEPPAPAAPAPSASPPDSAPRRAERPSALTSITGSYRQPTNVHRLPERTVRIGRALENDLVIDDLSVSRTHAELRARPDGSYEIADVGSHNGTFLNGQPVLSAVVQPGDLVGIGHSVFCLVGDELQEFVDTGVIALQVEGLSVQVGDDERILLDAVSFPVAEKSLLAVVGPSGAGKSTLLNALTGMRPADRGSVRYDGRDLYRDYAELRQRIGLVPQDDILHTQLTVRRALSYAAELRFPGDTEDAERADRVQEVIAELGLEQRADQVISSLSGGQRKRVSVALELLTKPSLLFLDEPTSGLDPGMDRSVMHLLRRLADDGRTVIVVTHSVLNLEVCDRLLVLAPGGRIAYFGPPDKALDFFGFEQWPEAFEAFEAEHERDWAARYQGSEPFRQYITTRMQPAPVRDAAEIAYPEPPKAQSWFAQLSTLVRRYVAALSADRTFLAVMIILPFVMGAMARALAGSRLDNSTALNALLILCVGGLLIGAANSVRELVKERAVYRRERAVGLSRSAYLWSKIVVLGSVTVAQAVVMTVIGLAGVRIRAAGGGVLMPAPIEITLAVALLSFTAMMLGLVVSALVSKEEVTMPLLVLLAIIQVVFCGALLRLHGVPVLEQLSWLVPSRWALAAMASTIDLRQVVPGTLATDPLFAHKAGTWLLDMGAMVLMSLVLGLLVARLLRRHEPTIMRG